MENTPAQNKKETLKRNLEIAVLGVTLVSVSMYVIFHGYRIAKYGFKNTAELTPTKV